ncbi:2-hydroxyacid dehydrogenase [Dorea sp. D27]|uniref:2-hydroxyacid dehydrogenase n=1 Tax=Dorea sp. D27 TaxID=658665 RepID=UPI0006A01177|nr:2-hydroxyacid dehydrogenase [Dorea sp. D27]KMZ55157.1 D-3-phosphoglycerate dehydrogenase [Dorea sp. D27]
MTMMNEAPPVRRVVVVGDAYVSPAVLQEAAKALPFSPIEIIPFMWGTGDKDEFSEMQTKLEHDGPDAVPYPEGLQDAVKTADLLMVHFCPVPEKLVLNARRLKLVGICRGGYENIDASALKRQGIPLIHIIRNAEAVAEFTLGMMLAETRNIARSHKKICDGQWPVGFSNAGFTSTLKNLTVGIIGLGNIGALLARKLHALGVKVIGYDAYLTADAIRQLPAVPADSMEDIFRQADIVSLHLRLTAENRGMIGPELLSLMKRTAYLINASRAGLIDESALLHVLKDHSIAGAALDVFEHEPLSADHPYLTLDNITLTPHMAGDTVDSIANSPFPLVQAITEYWETGNSRNVCNLS